jgi:hypothetical protein
MEVVITYIKGYPNKTNLTYRPIEDDVVERIVAEYESIVQKEQKEQKEQKTKIKKTTKKENSSYLSERHYKHKSFSTYYRLCLEGDHQCLDPCMHFPPREQQVKNSSKY